uniref:C2H2-type domain-containing protein n=1 Tax=Steinernema glaseri TaxID=37863 RepID=A0A1I7ZIN6_9BILA
MDLIGTMGPGHNLISKKSSMAERYDERWIVLRKRLINMCLRRGPHSEVECLVCDMAFPRMFEFELHLITEHLNLARSASH